MLETPRKFTVVSGSAEGPSRLNAFDNALLAAGIGNLNLLKVSSILPPGAVEVPQLDIPPGALVPTAYGAIVSEVPNERIAAAVGVGIGADGDYGVIMEFSGRCSREEAEAEVRRMCAAAFEARGRALDRVIVAATEHRVREVGCAFAAVALWY
ncbi:Pyruvoyl-dependent arginine decarboxylase [Candidatus Hydrogenisulfobacillus filiaventi]|uniref:Pyruvoyl-dependent arginine decarboxylase AaxB n=1 Tax=Candidatus Hydrogenisulfobacillus filiaventi TaxID=2707344 RepID=A0A6F8ZKH4_9FIRM|nr:arginine decarboxylase, pyruvoyl-dependent [Bacillota bacterium]CAB1130237.1 Pyruvoyl-dependent arginine decarboxylase [Candidatus Hydrogenisulfobacillus filiaventi]